MIALGRSAPGEMLLMVTEKIDAMEQAKALIISGGVPLLVVDHYRKMLRQMLLDCQVTKKSVPERAALQAVRSTNAKPAAFYRAGIFSFNGCVHTLVCTRLANWGIREAGKSFRIWSP
jgi:hypothetical protein